MLTSPHLSCCRARTGCPTFCVVCSLGSPERVFYVRFYVFDLEFLEFFLYCVFHVFDRLVDHQLLDQRQRSYHRAQCARSRMCSS